MGHRGADAAEAEMQAGQTEVHDHVDDAGQGDDLMHRQEHDQKGKATMAPPMPLTPDTKPPAIQARNTLISVIPGIRPSCGRRPPHQYMKSKRRCRSGPSADSGKRAWRMAGGASARRKAARPPGDAMSYGAARPAGRGMPCGLPFVRHGILPSGDCLRELPRAALPCPRPQPLLRPAHSMLRRVPAFWQPGTRGKTGKPLTRLHQGLICHGGSCGVRTCDSLLKKADTLPTELTTR